MSEVRLAIQSGAPVPGLLSCTNIPRRERCTCSKPASLPPLTNLFSLAILASVTPTLRAVKDFMSSRQSSQSGWNAVTPMIHRRILHNIRQGSVSADGTSDCCSALIYNNQFHTNIFKI